MPALQATGETNRPRRQLALRSMPSSLRPAQNRRLAAAAATLATLILAPLILKAADPSWSSAAPLRQVSAARFGPMLADIDGHMPAGHGYENPADPINWTHETTHGLHARLRTATRANGAASALYVGGTRFILLREPRITINQTAANVPADLRTEEFRDYLVQQAAHWNHQPLYILDEWTAYTNDTQTAVELIELGHRDNGAEGSAQRMIQFCGFAATILRTVAALDPNYPDRAQLEAFITWQVGRALDLAAQVQRLIRAPLVATAVARFKREFIAA